MSAVCMAMITRLNDSKNGDLENSGKSSRRSGMIETYHLVAATLNVRPTLFPFKEKNIFSVDHVIYVCQLSKSFLLATFSRIKFFYGIDV